MLCAHEGPFQGPKMDIPVADDDRTGRFLLNSERRVEERTAKLQKALQAKSELLSRASHELRTPMNHILGFAQLLASRNGLTEKQEASVRQILESGCRLLTVIDHILGFSKSDPSELSSDAARRTANGH
jgi:signal transduction histidine kinase